MPLLIPESAVRDWVMRPASEMLGLLTVDAEFSCISVEKAT